MHMKQPHQLMSSTAQSVALPARLKVKWLRADCLSVLDLRSPEVKLTVSAWKSLLLCLSVVPGLKVPALRLPRGELPQPPVVQPPVGSHPNVIRPRIEHLRGCVCQYCDRAAYQQMRQATNRGGQNFHFTANIPDGVSVTWQSTCTRCGCDLQ